MSIQFYSQQITMLDHSFFSQHPLMILLNIIQLVNLPIMFLNEKKDAMPYSKFASKLEGKAKESMIPSKQGMLIIYVPALLTSMLFLISANLQLLPGFSINIAAGMVMTHFLKRTLEVMFLHKYSGTTSEAAAKMIGVGYAIQAALICGTSSSNPSHQSIALGTSLFIIGLVGNFYHHYLLRLLRSARDKTSSDEKHYVAPRGGLFEYVAAPHYLFELIGWLGTAIASEQVTAYLVFGGMMMYLSARSINQNQWNQNKFSERQWPKTRGNLVPIVF